MRIRKEKIFTNCLHLIIGVIFIVCSQQTIAQYPVRSQITFIPPYSPNLSDYYTGTTERFVVTLTNTDFANPLRKVRLRLNIKSNAVTLRSKDNVYYPIIELDAGVPTRLSLNDLAPYFNPGNIDASGVDYNFLSKNPRLPDGYYSFRFDVIDANTGQVLNNTLLGELNIRITTNDPPLLNLPQNKDNISFRDPINIIFNWTPRQIGISSAEYEFSLYEINDNGMPPENASFVSQPIYQTTTYTTTLLYGPTEPQLLPGKKYAWRVKATAMSGGDAYDLFRNNGYSETYWFQLQDNCPPVQQVAATVKNGAVTINWLDNPQMYEYTVEYRKVGNATNRWFTTTTRTNRVVITNVSENNTYEYKVGGTCTVGAGATFSDVKAFTIPPRDSIRDMQCGIMPNINLSNKTAIDKLNIGDVVNVGDFPVMITDLTSTVGSFSGKGYITIPFLGDVRVKVKFDNVLFNTDKQLIQGFMVTTYDKTESQIVDPDEIFKNGGIVLGNAVGDSTVDYKLDFPLLFPQTAKVSGERSGFTITLNDKDGTSHTITGIENLPATFKDSNGDVYEIDKNGEIKKAELTPIIKNTNNSISSDNGNQYVVLIYNSSRTATIDSVFGFNEIKYFGKKNDSIRLEIYKYDTNSKAWHRPIAKWGIGSRTVNDSICHIPINNVGSIPVLVKVGTDSLLVTELDNGRIIKTDTIMKFEVNVVDQLLADWDYQNRSLYNGEFGFDIPEYDQFKTLYHSYNRGNISTLAPDLFLKQGQTVTLKLNFKNNNNIPRGYFAEFESTNGQVTITPNRLNRSDLQRTSMNISFTTSASDVFDNLIVRLKDTSGNVLTTIRIKSDSIRQRNIEFVKVITNNNDNVVINTNSWASNINTLNNNMFVQNYVNWNATSTVLDLRPTINNVKEICRVADSLRLINPTLDRRHLFDSLRRSPRFTAYQLSLTYYSFENLDKDTLVDHESVYSLIATEHFKSPGIDTSSFRGHHYAFITNKFIGDLLGAALRIPNQNDEPTLNLGDYYPYVLITRRGNMNDLGHELGHSLSLSHPFHLTKYQPIPKLNTILNGIGNVMDYGSPTKSFWKWQSSNIIKFLKLLNP